MTINAVVKCRMPNKPLAIMAADVKTQTSALRENISDYPQCCLLDAATIASAKTCVT